MRDRARAAFRRHGARWAVAQAVPAAVGDADGDGVGGRSEAVLDVPLHPPTERAALADPGAAVAWVAAWRDPGMTGDVTIRWEVRAWSGLGRQEVPVRVRFGDAATVAAAAGTTEEWHRLVTRCEGLVQRWGRSSLLAEAMRRHAPVLGELPDEELARLVAVVDWFVDHPRSGLLVRQVPVPGVHTKWVETHRGIVTGLVAARTGSSDLGLVEPAPLVRVRVLDPTLRPGGLHDLATDLAGLARLALPVRRVVLVENLACLQPLPDAPGVVAVHGSGYAVDRLRDVPWLADAPVTYWGDLDSHGFSILDRVRAHLPHVDSVLMDLSTLRAHRDLCVPEPIPATGELTRLTPAEAAARDELAVLGHVRLEQERLPWPDCLRALRLDPGR
ncbi:Wadjet anti-phage system protein JetD domain-containing protein [Cellulomonas marina]|uniref:Wadjet protein JetD C-terminal domain-containing protein n=1 Tax=Cellulomonas marina TaxID=988821 RepID=A0A1I1AFY5_9CELL|nr:DUF3322 and DUF2220 domain-containing protein [Cellulomonas marina]GIG30209.1 hypothetical protein Cma02nite_28090 [Cellulomonas marina]SFB36945.1 hypothetical protein SAMN05421867_11816 [Cellulomonas marina]